MKKFNKKLFLRYGIFILIVAIIIFLIMLFSNKETEGYTSPPPAVEIIKPQNTDIQQSISISGYVEALDMIPVVPFVSGTIMEYPIKSGMQINKGDLIAKIDDEPYKQQMLQAKAAYLGYQSTFERVENLYKANAATQQNYDSAKAQRDAAKAQYDLAILQMSYTEVTSPSTGTVLMAPLAKGSIGSTQQPAAIIADLSNPFIHICFFTQREENRDLLPKFREVYEEFLKLPYPISMCPNKEYENENRLRYIETQILNKGTQNRHKIYKILGIKIKIRGK